LGASSCDEGHGNRRDFGELSRAGPRAAAPTVRTFRLVTFRFGKDASLISRLSIEPTLERPGRPRYKLCARGAPRTRWLSAMACALGVLVASVAPAQQAARVAPPSTVRQAQFTQVVPPPAAGPQQPGFRRVQIFPRSDVGPQAEWLNAPSGENVLVISGGVNVVVQDLTVEGFPDFLGPLGNVDIETDRAVIWTSGLEAGNLGQVTQQSDAPLEIYMEGNIVFRQGDRVVYADRMFYDVRRHVGIVLDAELLTPVPQMGHYQYQGLVRLKADVLRQLDQSRFVAQDGFVTTSRLEDPSYDLSSETITLQDVQQPVIDPVTGMPAINPATGEPIVTHQQLAQSKNNFLNVDGLPVFYWPTMATDLQKPSYYVNNLRVRNDSIFGFQTLLELDGFQMLGLDPVPGVEWDLDLDYLSKRGLGFGMGAEYGRDQFFGLLGPTTGRADAWFINDNGVDNLGLGRRDIVPEKKFRGRTFWNHRQRLVGGWLDDWTAQAEVGWISDRTFLEQYYEDEWDQNKDQTTGVRLKRTYDNQAFSVETNAWLNGFFTETQWLPRADHYWLGQDLIGSSLTWFEHSSAAYANIGIAGRPTNPTLASQWTLLPWEVDSMGLPIDGQGERFVSRQEVDWPLDFAPVKVVPYALGELGDWGADLDGNDIQRAFYQVGLRASIPFWAVDPTIHDPLFNLNGLAHKVVFDAELYYAEANRDITQFPLYDELDDNSIEEFRRRLFFSPVGGSLAGSFNPKFDPRFYALRTDIQSWVTSPTSEIADDLTAMRVGMHHRLQTKRGAPGEQRIVDWVTFDTNITWFPDPNRDDFGSDFGLADYDFRWHIGDRVALLSDGAADFFGEGLKTASLGMLLNRPTVGNAYVGFRTMDGPFHANVLLGSVNYRMSPKWIGSTSASIDLADTGNISNSFGVSRIGESLIATVGANYDQSKGDFGVSFLVEPRFLPNLSVTRKTGIEVPPAGSSGLE
jgi:hypothetical protein